MERAYFVSDPLKNLRGFDTTPQTQRRAITTEEVRRLLAVCPTSRRLLWETALLSGLRANELRHLSVDHLDVGQGGLHLEADWTKNRRDDFLPLPRSLVDNYAQAETKDFYTVNVKVTRQYKPGLFNNAITARHIFIETHIMEMQKVGQGSEYSLPHKFTLIIIGDPSTNKREPQCSKPHIDTRFGYRN